MSVEGGDDRQRDVSIGNDLARLRIRLASALLLVNDAEARYERVERALPALTSDETARVLAEVEQPVTEAGLIIERLHGQLRVIKE